MGDLRTVLKVSAVSRVVLIIAQYVFNVLIPDHNAGVFTFQTDEEKNVLDLFVEHFLGGFLRWDAHYYMHIAKYGYTYENATAFFPLLPFTVRLIADWMKVFMPFISQDSILLLVFIAVNIFVFILANIILYRITLIFFDKSFSLKVCILYSINPASIFFIAPYSECFYSFLTFTSIQNSLKLYEKYRLRNFNFGDISYILAQLVPVCLSTLTRSNGILNIGFFVYALICLLLNHLSRCDSLSKRIMCLTKFSILTILSVIVSIAPFIFYQYYCYNLFCTDFETKLPNTIVSYAESNNFVLPGQFNKHNQSWCYDKFPLAYSYVQKHYWNVGFLKYYEIKQIPNFLLSLPIFILVLKNCLNHVMYNFPKTIPSLFSFNMIKRQKAAITSLSLNVFVIHCMFLAIFCIFFIHIQVSTRMLCSSSPYLFWICASYFESTGYNTDIWQWIKIEKQTLPEKFVKCYFISYFLIGTMLFVNFLPWT